MIGLFKANPGKVKGLHLFFKLADLRDADLTEAKLIGTGPGDNLIGADLNNANLTGANLSNADVEEQIFIIQ